MRDRPPPGRCRAPRHSRPASVFVDKWPESLYGGHCHAPIGLPCSAISPGRSPIRGAIIPRPHRHYGERAVDVFILPILSGERSKCGRSVRCESSAKPHRIRGPARGPDRKRKGSPRSAGALFLELPDPKRKRRWRVGPARREAREEWVPWRRPEHRTTGPGHCVCALDRVLKATAGNWCRTDLRPNSIASAPVAADADTA